jgi:hypothetical protein
MARFQQDMNDDFTVLTTQNCDLKTRLADLQVRIMLVVLPLSDDDRVAP